VTDNSYAEKFSANTMGMAHEPRSRLNYWLAMARTSRLSRSEKIHRIDKVVA
jgi:hypothetical protein